MWEGLRTDSMYETSHRLHKEWARVPGLTQVAQSPKLLQIK